MDACIENEMLAETWEETSSKARRLGDVVHVRRLQFGFAEIEFPDPTARAAEPIVTHRAPLGRYSRRDARGSAALAYDRQPPPSGKRRL